VFLFIRQSDGLAITVVWEFKHQKRQTVKLKSKIIKLYQTTMIPKLSV